jgi:multidrug efflux pump subunit AcrB
MRGGHEPAHRPAIIEHVAGSSLNIARWSIEHPYVVIAFYTAMVVLAVIAIGFYMPRRFMPYVQSPMIGIVSMMPGLSAQEMEMYISKPIEERLINIPGVRYIRSTSQEGFSIVLLEFPYGTDIDKKLVEVQALLNVIQADLPMTGANLKPSWVLKIDPLNLPVLSLALTGDHRWDMKRLRELADNEISNRLKAVSPDIFTVQVFGGYRRQIQVIVDRKKLAAYGISTLQLRQVLDAHNVAKPAGVITTDADQAYYALRGGFTNEFFRMENKRQTTILIRYDEKDRLSPEDIELLAITTPDGKQVPLKAVARVEYHETPTLIEHDNFRRVVSVMGYYRKAHYVPPWREGEQVRNRPSMDVAMDVMMRAQMQLNWPPRLRHRSARRHDADDG